MHSEKFLKKVYSPRGIASKAVYSGLMARKSFAQIHSELVSAGRNISRRSLYNLARQMKFRRGIKFPAPKRGILEKQSPKLVLHWARETMLAEGENTSTRQLAKNLGIEVSAVLKIKKALRKEGFPLKVYPSVKKDRALVEFTPAERQWMFSHFSLLSNAVGSISAKKNFSSSTSEKLLEYVIRELPSVLRRYRPNEKYSLEKYVRFVIHNYISKTFIQIEIAKSLGISEKASRKFIGFLLDRQKGASFEDAARKRKLSVEYAKRLIELYDDSICNRYGFRTS